MAKEIHRHIAPRLASGLSREANGHALPQHIKQGLRMIAARENQSMSWVIEQIIYAFFGFAPPAFVGERGAGVINPEHHARLIKQISREKAEKHARQRASLTKRGGQIIERAERNASIN